MQKLQPFYFFADLLDYSIGENYRRTIVAKIQAESAAIALYEINRFYRYTFRTKDQARLNIIPATEDDFIEFQKSLGIKVINPMTMTQPKKERADRSTDISKQEFGLLTAKERLAPKFSKPDKHGRIRRIEMWRFECRCGTIKDLRRDNVTGGSTLSCGCIKSAMVKVGYADRGNLKAKILESIQ